MKTTKKVSRKSKMWTFSKPPAKEAKAIAKTAKAMRSGKVRSIPLGDIIKKLEKH